MATFIGYNTINQYKDYTLTDFELIKRDFLNSLNIKQGEKVGRPLVGTTMWNLIFEPQTPQTVTKIKNEIQRLVDLDPRINLTQASIYAQNNLIIVEVEVETVATQGIQQLQILFDQESSVARYV